MAQEERFSRDIFSADRAIRVMLYSFFHWKMTPLFNAGLCGFKEGEFTISKLNRILESLKQYNLLQSDFIDELVLSIHFATIPSQVLPAKKYAVMAYMKQYYFFENRNVCVRHFSWETKYKYFKHAFRFFQRNFLLNLV